MKKIHLFFVLTILALSPATVIADVGINTNAIAAGDTIVITGQITGVTESQKVTVLGGNIDDINNIYNDDMIFIGQQDTDTNGNFSFELPLPDNLPSGTYKYYIGSKILPEPYQSTFEYATPSGTEIINADINVTITNFVPTISGTIRCNEGREISLNITNVTNASVIANDTIHSDGRDHYISYTLPNLLIARDYTINMTCTSENGEILNMTFNISSSMIFISAEGTITTSDSSRIVGNVQTLNLGGINKDFNFSGEKAASFTIPNVAANMSFEISAIAYENIIETSYMECMITDLSNNETILTVTAENISTFADKTFVLSYDSEKVSVINVNALFGIDDITISNSENEIRFTVPSTVLQKRKNGVIALFKCIKRPDFSDTKITIDVINQ